MLALWIAARDPRTPWYAKATAGLVAAYALSPIDLIPDFIPALGYLDNLLIVPLGVVIAARLIPQHLMLEYRTRASERNNRPVSYTAAALIAMLWLAALTVLGYWAWRVLGR